MILFEIYRSLRHKLFWFCYFISCIWYGVIGIERFESETLFHPHQELILLGISLLLIWIIFSQDVNHKTYIPILSFQKGILNYILTKYLSLIVLLVIIFFGYGLIDAFIILTNKIDSSAIFLQLIVSLFEQGCLVLIFISFSIIFGYMINQILFSIFLFITFFWGYFDSFLDLIFSIFSVDFSFGTFVTYQEMVNLLLLDYQITPKFLLVTIVVFGIDILLLTFVLKRKGRFRLWNGS